MATKYQLAEQVIRRFNGGDRSAGSGLDIREVILLVGQVANQMLKVEFFSVDINQQAESRPVVIASYRVAVEDYKDVSMIRLPVIPVKLPMGMGVWSIQRTDALFSDMSFIPVPAGAWTLHKGMGLLSDLLGQVGYMWEGTDVFFTRSLAGDGVSEVDVKMIVVDVMHLGDYDPLPIPVDMEAGIIQDVFNLLVPRGATDKVADSHSDNSASINPQTK